MTELRLPPDQRAKLREFMKKRAVKVEFEDPKYDWGQPVSVYGWHDHTAYEHVSPSDKKRDGCSWVVPEGAVLREVVYSQFDSTFTGNRNEVGVECSPVHCACGEYTDVTLRWTGSLAELMKAVFGNYGEEIVL